MHSATIAACATPSGTGGIAVIRVSGPDAITIAESVFSPAGHKKLTGLSGYTAAFGRFFDAHGPFDEGVALVFRAPASFTGEDIVELTCHGGVYLSERLLAALLSAGARPAGPGEFSKRAFINGKIDLAQAESILNLIQASSQTALHSAYEDRNGRLSHTVTKIKEDVLKLISGIAAWIDYPEEDIPPPTDLKEGIYSIKETLQHLLRGYENSRILREGIHTAIIGRPNTGKSALMNRLSGLDRSIVTPLAGTTRDVIEESVRMGPFILRLSDTAGIRTAGDPIEMIGIERALQKARQAELIFAVFDISQPWTEDDFRVLEACRDKKAIALLNKCDLPACLKTELLSEMKYVLPVSAVTGEGIERLDESLRLIFNFDSFEQSAPFTARQRNCVQRALASVEEAAAAAEMLTPDVVQYALESAVSALMELTGESVTDQILEQVFSRFCIGK